MSIKCCLSWSKMLGLSGFSDMWIMWRDLCPPIVRMHQTKARSGNKKKRKKERKIETHFSLKKNILLYVKNVDVVVTSWGNTTCINMYYVLKTVLKWPRFYVQICNELCINWTKLNYMYLSQLTICRRPLLLKNA